MMKTLFPNKRNIIFVSPEEKLKNIISDVAYSNALLGVDDNNNYCN